MLWLGGGPARRPRHLIPARLSGLLLAVVAPIANGAVGQREGDAARCAKASLAQCGWRKAPRPAHWSGTGGTAAPRRTCRRRSLLNVDARKKATPGDIGRALDLYVAACLLQAAVYAALALVA